MKCDLYLAPSALCGVCKNFELFTHSFASGDATFTGSHDPLRVHKQAIVVELDDL